MTPSKPNSTERLRRDIWHVIVTGELPRGKSRTASLSLDDSKKVKAIMALIAAHDTALLERVEKEVVAVADGRRIDREATRKHMESKGASENDLLNMETEADDLDDTIDGVIAEQRKALAALNKELRGE
jgi:vacuolar-type H+-ATPase subunit I/STV1